MTKGCMNCASQNLFDIDDGDCRECMQIEEDTGVEFSKWKPTVMRKAIDNMNKFKGR